MASAAQSYSSGSESDVRPKSMLLNTGSKRETDSEECARIENASRQDPQDCLIFKSKSQIDAIRATESFNELNNDREENEKLIKMYKQLSAVQSRRRSHKYGPLYRKGSRKLFLSENRACWVALLDTHLLIYHSEQHNQPYAIYAIRGYMARPISNLILRGRRKNESAFEMYCPGSETLQFIALTRKEMDQWIAKVHEVGCSDESKTDGKVKINEKKQTSNATATEKREDRHRRVARNSTVIFRSKTWAKSRTNKNEVEQDTSGWTRPSLPVRIPLRLPSTSSPSNDIVPHYEALTDEYDDDDIYDKIADLNTFYQSIILSRKQQTNSFKKHIVIGHDDNMFRETKHEERVDPTSPLHQYDIPKTVKRVKAVASIEEVRRNYNRVPVVNDEETLYDDVEELKLDNTCEKRWIWNYCTKSDDQKFTICNICDARFEYSGSTSTLNKHLRFVHSLMKNEISARNYQSENTDLEEIDQDRNESELEISASFSESYINTDIIRRLSRERRQGPKKEERCGAERQEQISRALAKLIVTNQLPLSFVQSDGLQQFMTVVEPGYVVPATETILSRLQLIYNEIKTFLQSEMQEQGASISCSTDIWTSTSRDSFLSIMVHYIDKRTWKLKNHTICTVGLGERHTAENIALALEMVLSDWNLENKIFTVVHNNPTNMVNARRILQSIDENINCSAHTLQLAINDSLQSEEIICVIQKARKIVSHFKQSSLATKELRSIQLKLNFPEERLIQSCETKWESTYHMCERLKNNKIPILAVLSNTSVTELAQAKELEMSTNEWSIIEKLVILLKPLQYVITVFSLSSEVTISLVRPVIRSILDNYLIKDVLDDNFVSNFKRILRQSLSRYFNMIPKQNQLVSVYQIASFLDPRHKDLKGEPFKLERAKIRDYIKEKLQVPIPTDAPEASPRTTKVVTALDFIFQKRLSSVETEWQKQLDYYEMETAIGHNESPLDWWKTRAKKYPAISELARKYLTIPATSASSEREYSSAGNILIHKYNYLNPETVNLMVFLYENRQFFCEN